MPVNEVPMLPSPGQEQCVLLASREERCVLVGNHRGRHMTQAAFDALEADRLNTASSDVVVFSYPGRTQADAAVTFQSHAATLAKEGYTPISQSWGEGRPGIGRVLAIGVFSTAMRPKGFLTVTYKRSSEPEPPLQVAPSSDPIDQIKRLGELRDAGLITPEEFEAKKADLMSRL